MQEPRALEGINPQALEAMTTTARDKTWQAVHAIAHFIKPGMNEKQAIKLANEYLASQGVKRFWHRTHIRFGTSTVLSFEDSYADNVVLQDNDIFYIDIGPVWDGVEGDCGDTFTVGNFPEGMRVRQDLHTIFAQVRDLWRRERPSGTDLYAYANQQVQQMGYLLHPSYVKGHRLSEFCHFNYTKVGVADLDFSPSPERWILELQICDKDLRFGAFYEDLLD